jgi:uncharacterized protein (TIGR03067 family)
MFGIKARYLLVTGIVIGGIGLVAERALRAQSPSDAKAANENAKKRIDLEGTWEVVELTRSDLGAKVLPNEDMSGVVVFQEDTFRFTTTSNGKVQTRTLASFTLDQSLNTGSIDLTYIGGPDHGQVALGIFELNGDELKICVSQGNSLNERPTDFKAETDTNRVLYVLRRLER